MRLAPVPIFWHREMDIAEAKAREQSTTTHGADAAVEACALYTRLIVEAIQGASKQDVLRPRPWPQNNVVQSISEGSWKEKTRDQIESSGYVIHTLEAALWCVARSSDFREAVLLAANLGRDADTVAAVTGQLAGAIWGEEGVPEEWIQQLAWSEKIRALGLGLFEFHGAKSEPV
jgi:ADP-ribosyl-[dinitrogen reductase] hydrolase